MWKPKCENENLKEHYSQFVFLDANINQFRCICGWVSDYDSDFIKKYKRENYKIL